MKPSKTAILTEVIERNTTAAVRNKVVLKGDFASQDAFINDPSRFLVAQCSRRAGKSNGLALRFFKTLEKYPKSQCLYLALTQESARGIMWPILQEINDRYALGCTFTESRLEMKHPNGAKLKLMGADLKDYIKRLKGRKFPGIAIDEAQDMGAHLQSLIDDVLTPSVFDYTDGWIALTGTPGPVPQGYYFDITQNGKYGYSLHKWTMLDNPYMPDPQSVLAKVKADHEWQDDNPTLQREYLNRWVLDVNSLWVRYNEKANHYQELPKEHKWSYVMGIDIGFNDADAIAVLAWSDTTPVTYLVEEKITTKQGITELGEQIQALDKKYSVSRMVIDEGGLGKKAAEELRRRLNLPLEAADKARKQENVELLNDELRTGKFKAKSASRFAQDSYLVQIDWERSTPDKVVIKKKPHSDIIDAVLYAYKASYAYTHTPEKEKPKPGTKEWADQQSNDMWERELEGYSKEMEYSNWLKNGGYG
jgi:hypothetical protein